MHSLQLALSESVIQERNRRGRDVFAPSGSHLGLDDPDLDVGSHPLGRALIRAVGGLAAEKARSNLGKRQRRQ